MSLHPKPRAAFTLIELIVVISIIILLATLSTAAVMRVREAQRENNTDIHIRKLHMGLDQQYKAAVDRIKMEDPPQVVKDFTLTAPGQYDNMRAKALHMKLRLRQEFPQNFAEVRTPVTVVSPLNGATYVYSANPTYLAAIKDAQGVTPELDQTSPLQESAVLLPLILAQTRGGVSFDVDNAAPFLVIDLPRVQIPPNPPPPPGSTLQLRVYVDSYGGPIAFRRAANDTQVDVLNELNSPPFVSAAQMVSQNKDPHDPEGRLKLNWPMKGVALSFFATAPLANPFDGLNRGPYVYSAGRDLVYGNDGDLHSFRLQSSGQGN